MDGSSLRPADPAAGLCPKESEEPVPVGAPAAWSHPEEPTSPGRANVAGEVTVIVGTSETVIGNLSSAALVQRIVAMVNHAYGYSRLSEYEVAGRLEMGDAGPRANRVLHLASRCGTLVGACSSTVQTPWTPYGCGHWGLLVVAHDARGTSVASALVRAAEQRLRDAGRSSVQIEYEYSGDAFSDRLYGWYEGSCGFQCPSGPPGGRPQFRRCRKSLHSPNSAAALAGGNVGPNVAAGLVASACWAAAARYWMWLRQLAGAARRSAPARASE